jgi:hypothetical protein
VRAGPSGAPGSRASRNSGKSSGSTRSGESAAEIVAEISRRGLPFAVRRTISTSWPPAFDTVP